MDHLRQVVEVIQKTKNQPKTLVALAANQPVKSKSDGIYLFKEISMDINCLWLFDPIKELHRALGLGKTRWGVFFRPGVLLGYLGAIWRGHYPSRPEKGEDLLQLGGDFFWSKNRELVWAYRSQNPTDRPSLEEIGTVLGTWG